MNGRKGFLLIAAIAVIVSVFLPWVLIQSREMTISGMQTEGTTYGKPGLLSLIFTGLVLIFSSVPRIWAHRICIYSSAIHCGWAVRNFILLSTCQGGECPQRQTAFYIYLFSSILLLVAVLVQNQKLKQPFVE